MHADNSMMANKKDHKLFSKKRVLPNIQHKKAAVTPRVLQSNSTELHNTANSKVDNDSSTQSTAVVYSPSVYADDTGHMTSHDAKDDTVDGDTQLAIDVLRSQSDSSIFYHYSSRPHSAHRKSPSAKYNFVLYYKCYNNFKFFSTSLSTDRGPCMDDDFYSSGSSSSVGDATVEASPSHVQRMKHQLKPPDQLDTAPSPTDSSPVPLLRLSQVLNTNTMI